MKSMYLILTLLFTGGCYSMPVDVVISGDGVDKPSKVRPASEIRIYRSFRPPGEFREIGILHTSGVGAGDIVLIFKKFREAAAAKGADAVLDFRIDTERKVVTVRQRVCNPDGQCRTEQRRVIQINHTASATLISKTGEKK